MMNSLSFCLSGNVLITSLYFKKLINLFLAVLGFCCSVWAFSSYSEWGLLLFVTVHRLLIAVASLVAEHGL